MEEAEESERQRILGRERREKVCEFAVYFCHGRDELTHPMIWISLSLSHFPLTCIPRYSFKDHIFILFSSTNHLRLHSLRIVVNLTILRRLYLRKIFTPR